MSYSQGLFLTFQTIPQDQKIRNPTDNNFVIGRANDDLDPALYGEFSLDELLFYNQEYAIDAVQELYFSYDICKTLFTISNRME